MTPAATDALIEAHLRAEIAGQLVADVDGRADPVIGPEQIAACCAAMLGDLTTPLDR